MKNKVLKVVLACMMIVSFVATTGFTTVLATSVKKAAAVKLTFNVNFGVTEVNFKNLATVIKNFEKDNPGITVEMTNPADYENTMKTKMAANQLPDLWTTHGWSVMRYSEYLLPIQDQPFVKLINPLIKPVVTNDKKQVFVLPMDVDCAGIAFNKDVLDKAKVDPKTIKTWSDFKAACVKIKAIGKIPVYLGGSKDDWTVGNFFDWVAPTFTVTGTPSYAKQLLDGTYNWNNYKPCAQLFVDYAKAGFFNKNANEGTYNEVGEALAKGNAAFALFGNYVIGEAKKFKTNAHFGFMPLPAVKKGDPLTLISGERTAVGIWKDTEHKAEALKFLNYLARPESVNLISSGGLNPTGLVGKGYVTNAGDQTAYYNMYTNVKTYGYWDRAYLPSGMWDSLCKTGTGMLAGTMTIPQAVAKLKADYDKLRQQ